MRRSDSGSPRFVALAGVSFAALLFGLQAAVAGSALPAGGQYVAGKGTIAGSGSNLSINQSSTTGIIDWSSFSIGQNNAVNFNNGFGATLNRVTGGNLSEIAGSLHATGSLFLINPQGVIIDGTGHVLTGGSFVASSRDTSNDAFSARKELEFKGTSAGNVVNNGTIVSTGGDAVLIGNAATNNGSVSAKNGTAALAAGNDVLMQPTGGDQRLFVSGGTGDVTNTGTINSAAAELRAAGGNVYALSGNNGGIVRATGTQTIGGHVWLTSGAGSVTIGGAVSAQNANGTGGTIVATGNSITATGTANLSTSGTSGGTILIGGDIHGGAIAADNFVKETVSRAQTTTVEKGAQISANGTSGTGGKIVVWSDSKTQFDGTISANGVFGGGFAEVSSHDLLGFTGTADLTSTKGAFGTLLLDPRNVTITNTATTGGTFNGLSPNTFTPTADNSVILNTDLQNNLASANVVVTTGSTGTQNGDITVLSSVIWSANSTLTLNAAGNIVINAAISGSGATSGIDLISGGTISIDEELATPGTLTLTSGSTIGEFGPGWLDVGTLTGSSVGNTTLQAANNVTDLGAFTAAGVAGAFSLTNAATLTVNGAVHAAGNLTLTTTGPGNNLEIDAGLTGAIVGLGSSGSLDSNASGTIGGSTLAASSVGEMTIGGAVNTGSGSLSLTTTGSGSVLTISAALTGGALDLVSANAIDAHTASAVITATTLTGSSVGNATMTAPTNSVGTLGAFSTGGGGLALTDSGSLIVNGAVNSGAGTITLVSGGSISQPGGGITAAAITGSSVGAMTLTGANQIAVLDAIKAGAGFGLIDGQTVTVNGLDVGAIGSTGEDAGTGDLALITTSGDIVLNANLTAGMSGGSQVVTLESAGSIDQTSGIITAGYLQGSSVGATSLTDSNAIGTLESFNSGGAFALTDSAALTLDATLNATGQTVTLTDSNAGGMVEDGTGIIEAGTLGGSSSGITTFDNASNAILNLGNYTAAKQFALTDSSALTITGTLDASNLTPSLSRVTLVDTNAGGMSEGVSGIIEAYTLTGNSSGTTNFNNASNAINTLNGFSNTAGNFTLDDSSALTITATLDVTGSVLTLVDTGGGIDAHAAVVNAQNLTGSSTGVADFTNAGNAIDSVGPFTNTGGNFSLVDPITLSVSGTVDASGHTLSLTTTGAGHDIQVFAPLTAGTVELVSAGAINGLGGVITAGNLTGSSVGMTMLTAANKVSELDAFHAGTGFQLINDQTLTVAGTDVQSLGFTGVNSGTGNLTLTTTTGDIDLTTANGNLTAGTSSGTQIVTLNSHGAISQTGGIITAGILTGSSGGSTTLTGANLVGTLNASSTGTGFDLTDNQSLKVAGTVDAGTGALTLTTTGSGNITLAGNLIAGTSSGSQTVTLNSAGSISETTGNITGGTLTGMSAGATSLTSTSNAIGDLSTFTTTNGAFSLKDTVALTVNGSGVTAGTGGALTLTTTGSGSDLTLLAGLTTTGTANLYSSGLIVGTDAAAIINAGTLTGSSVGDTTLTANGAGNTVTNLGPFSTANGNFTFYNAQSLTVGGPINAGTGNLTLTTFGNTSDLTISALLTGNVVSLTAGRNLLGSGTIKAGTLNESAGTAVMLTGTQQVTSIGGVTTHGDYSFVNAFPLTVTGDIVTNGHNITLTTQSGSQLTINAALNAGTTGIVTLNSGGTISGNSSGIISALTLAGSSIGAVTLNAANKIIDLGAFTVTGGAFSLTDSETLTVTGAVKASTAPLVLTTTTGDIVIDAPLTAPTVDLVSAGAISQSVAGIITATTLLGSSVGATDLSTASNAIYNLGIFTTGTGFALNDVPTVASSSLTVNGAVTGGTGGLSLMTGTGHGLVIDAGLTAGTTVTLASGSFISSNSSGVINATTLTGSSHGAVNLSAPTNNITDLGAFVTNNGSFLLDDAATLTVTGAVNTGTGALTLVTLGSANLVINNSLSGGLVTLNSSGNIGGTGAITATTLTGSSSGALGVTLTNGANNVANLGAFTTSGNAFSLTDAASLTVTGVVDTTPGGALTLTTTGLGHNLTINSALKGGLVTLTSAGTIGSSLAGIITATTLTGGSSGNTTLNAANNIANLGNFGTGGGAFSLTDAASLMVTGAVNAGAGNLTLTTTGAGDNLTITGSLAGATVNLVSAGTIGGTGSVSATTLTGSSSGATTLTNVTNNVANLGAFTTNNGAFSLTDNASLTVLGPVNAGTGGVTLTTTAGHNLTINGAVTGGLVGLFSGGTLGGPGAITATTLSGSSAGAITLSGADLVTNLGPFTTGGNSFAFTNAGSLTVTGAVNAGTGSLSLTTTGAAHSLTVDAALTGSTINLMSAASIGDNSSGVITATTLTGSSVGATDLSAAANHVTNLGPFTTTNSNFAFTNAATLTVAGAINAGTGNLTLTTTGSGHNLNIMAPLTGNVVTLVSAGIIDPPSAGVITATTLTGSSHGAVTLNAANKISNLGPFTTNNGAFSLTDTVTLQVSGAVNTGTSPLTLITTGASHNIIVSAPLTGSIVTLTSAGTIAQSAGGIITATTLMGSSVGATTLTATNVVANLGSFSTAGGPFSFTDGASLSVNGPVNAGAGTISLTTTGSGHNLTINGTVSTTGTINLTSAGNETETANGAIIANLLNIIAVTGINNSAGHNTVAHIGVDSTTSGPNIPK